MKAVIDKKVPKLRFRGFSDSWQVKKLGDIAKFSKGKNVSKIDISSDGATNAIRYGELYTRYNEVIHEVHSKTNLEKSELIFSKVNDLIIPASGETAIDIATASCVMEGGVALGGDINIIRTPNNGVFLSYYLNNTKKIDIARLAQGQTVVHLYPSCLKVLSLFLPNLDEQEKIAGFLGVVDDRISGLQKKQELLKKYKKGMMQKLFNRIIRFEDSQGKAYPEWKEKKLKEVFRECTGRGGKTENMLSVTMNSGVVLFGSLDRKDNSSLDKSNYKHVEIGDIAYNSMRMWQGASGVSKYSGIVSPAYTVIRIDKVNVPEFWGYYFKLPTVVFTFQRYSQGLTSDTWNLKYKQLSGITLPIPCKDEQQKIAEFLSSLDDTIELTERQLEQAKQFKKSLLQQMFV